MRKNILRLLIITLAIPSVCLAKSLDEVEKDQCASGKGMTYKINFDFGPGTSSVANMDVKYITDGRTHFDFIENQGNKIFTGWYLESSLKTKVYAVWQVPVTVDRDSNGCAIGVSSTRIYAGYKNVDVLQNCVSLYGGSTSVTYKFGDGRADQTVTWGVGVAPSANQILIPTREGYNFDGWYLDQNFVYSYKDFGIPLLHNKNYCMTGDPYYENIKLYAKWVTPAKKYEEIFDGLLFSDLEEAKKEAAQYNGAYSKTKVEGDTLTLTLVTKDDAGTQQDVVVPFKFNNNNIVYNDNKNDTTFKRVQASMANILLVYAGLVEGGMTQEEAAKAMFEYDFSKATLARNGVAVTYGDTVDYSDTTQVKLIDTLTMKTSGVYIDGLPKSSLGSLVGDPSLFDDLPIDLLSGTDNGSIDYGTTENPKTGVYDYVIYLIIAMPVAYTLIRLVHRHDKFKHIN